MDYKEANKIVYNRYAGKFNEATWKNMTTALKEDRKLFLSLLFGKRILDLGSGPGRDSVFFKSQGFQPLCFDISDEMLRLCKEQGLKTQLGDLENLSFPPQSFDGVWACTSLLHMPKMKLPVVLRKINRILKDKGIFYVSMKEGSFEGWTESDKYPGCKRFFSLYSEEELSDTVSEHFNILDSSKVSIGEATFLNYLCRK